MLCYGLPLSFMTSDSVETAIVHGDSTVENPRIGVAYVLHTGVVPLVKRFKVILAQCAIRVLQCLIRAVQQKSTV